MSEIEKLIEELQNENFDFQEIEFYDKKIKASKLLRKALIYYNKLGNIKDKEEYKRLVDKLDSIMVSKIKSLNPSFDDSFIMEMLNCLKRGIFQYPIDIFVASNGYFAKEGTYDDFGSLYKMKTFMFRMNGKYHNVFDEMDFILEHPFRLTERVQLAREQSMNLSKFLSDSINNLLSPSGETRVVKPVYELNTDKIFYGTSGLTHADPSGVEIYLSKNFPNIAKSIISNEECDIEMLVQNGDDIKVYNFHQLFKDGSPVWCGEQVDTPVWRLSEEAIKHEKGVSIQKKK